MEVPRPPPCAARRTLEPGSSALDDNRTAAGGGAHWGEEVFRTLRGHGIRFVATVPDGGLRPFLERCEADPGVRLITLTTEEEGIALACGTWLGGELAVVAMQSSGVGNIVNMLGLPNVCRIPCLLLVSMRGEAEERNRWQVPVGRAVPEVLAALGVAVHRPATASDVAPTFAKAVAEVLDAARRGAGGAAAVLVSQRIIGAKSFVDGTPPIPESGA
ncbi:thiamine pyrophosphate-binding protein [Candidatus Palauibacter sp.]|uniref:thiamine pyrophosphate-binding protein n=1 Tax=Candidatus Palauibacter sp. TaxID=3101350 RepID=UPI003B01035F